MILIDERPALEVVGGVAARELREWVSSLAVPRHRVANARGNALTRERLCDAFADEGLDVSVTGRFDNVVALPRRRRAGGLKLIAAHYDAVPHCPGADDNASGLAVLLASARRLTDTDWGFVAFNAEEEGMLGSADFVATTLPGLGELEVIHVLEMLGARRGCTQRNPLPFRADAFRSADFIGLVGKGASNAVVRRVVASKASPQLRVLGARTFGPIDRLLPDLRRSDHAPFWDAGLPAVMWTDTADFRNPHYHRSSDTAETLDYEFMADVLSLLVCEAGTSALSQMLPR